MASLLCLCCLRRARIATCVALGRKHDEVANLLVHTCAFRRKVFKRMNARLRAWHSACWMLGLGEGVESVHGGFCGELGVTDMLVGVVLVGSPGGGKGTCFVTPP